MFHLSLGEDVVENPRRRGAHTHGYLPPEIFSVKAVLE